METTPGVRLMTAEDLPAAMALKQAAGWNQTEQDWRLLLELQPDGCLVLEADERVAASATAFCYGRELAWIGMVLTLPEYRGRGFGTRVFERAVEFCVERGIGCIKLDATDMGRPLYERAGFAPEYEVERWGGEARAEATVPAMPEPGQAAVPLPSQAGVVELTCERLDALRGLDQQAFGVPRGALRAALRRGAEWAGCVERGGCPVGYALARPGARAHYFGPCVAEDAPAARALLQAFLSARAGQAVFVDVPAPNAEARRLLADYGLQVRRTLLRMYRGPNDHPGDPQRVFGLAGFEYG